MRSRIPLKLMKQICQTPDMIPVLAKGLYRKHVHADIDYARGDGRASKPPMQLALRITNVCNHRCAVCGQYGKKGYMHSEKGAELLKVLPVERYKQLVDEVCKYRPVIYFTGGEPFLYPGIMEVMKYAKSKGIYTHFVTNGVKLKEHAEQIVLDGWDGLMVSLDGPEDIHDKCRNVKGAFKTCIEGLIEIKKMKKKHKSVKPYVLTSTTISAVNAEHILETFEIGKLIEPDLMVLYLSWFTNKELADAQRKILKEELSVEAFTCDSYAKQFSEEEADLIAMNIKKLKKHKWPFHYMIIPDVGDANYKKYYLETGNYFGYKRCVAPFFMIDIMPNGDVTTCRDFVDIKVGNIMEKPLLEIWNDKPFVAFRKLLIKHKGTLPQCSRCCGLMGF